MRVTAFNLMEEAYAIRCHICNNKDVGYGKAHYHKKIMEKEDKNVRSFASIPLHIFTEQSLGTGINLSLTVKLSSIFQGYITYRYVCFHII
jgi:hypothetical protein